jgi:predicted phage terminase large subunit-like protein
MAGTEAQGGWHDPDWTAGVAMLRMQDQRSCIVDVKRCRHSPAQRDAFMEQVAKNDLKNYPGRIVWWIETETGIQGKERTQTLARRLQNLGLPVYIDQIPDTKKEIRAEPLASAAESGNILLGPDDQIEPWHEAFKLEMADVYNGRHDDQADGAVGAYNKMESNIYVAATTNVHEV